MYGYFVTSFRTVICNDVRINYDNELFENVNVRMYDIYSIPGTYIYSYHILKKKSFRMLHVTQYVLYHIIAYGN
jgi:hypothetical protein